MENESSYDGIPILSICGISLCLCEVTVTSNMHDSIMGIESSSFASKIVGLIYILLFVCLFVVILPISIGPLTLRYIVVTFQGLHNSRRNKAALHNSNRVTEYMQVSMLVNTMLCFNKRYIGTCIYSEKYASSTCI